jgi:hypothetical protein
MEDRQNSSPTSTRLSFRKDAIIIVSSNQLKFTLGRLRHFLIDNYILQCYVLQMLMISKYSSKKEQVMIKVYGGTSRYVMCIRKYIKYSQHKYFVTFLFYVYRRNKIVLRSQGPIINDVTILTRNIAQTLF